MNGEPIGLLLAAGVGQRFDPTGQRDKLLESIAIAGVRAMVLQHATEHLRQALENVVVVVSDRAGGRAAALASQDVEILSCDCSGEGIGSVLAWSIRRLPPGPILVALGDMPWLRPATIRAVAAAVSEGRAAAPTYQGRRGHPVGFPAGWRERLMTLHGMRGAADLLACDPPVLVECDDPGVITDIDMVADLLPSRPDIGL